MRAASMGFEPISHIMTIAVHSLYCFHIKQITFGLRSDALLTELPHPKLKVVGAWICTSDTRIFN